MDIEGSVEKTNFQTQVYNILENMIVHGKFKPGQRLVETELAVSLGVSRSPVREAIMALCQDRLIVNKKGTGWVVSEFSLQDIIETYEVRKLIESHAGMQGCMDCPKEVLEEMGAVLEELEKISEIEPFREKNRRFHELVVLSSGNTKFHEIFLWTMRNIRWCGYITMEIPGRMEQIRTEHRAILEGFLKRDPDSIGKAIENHISSLQNTIALKWNGHGF